MDPKWLVVIIVLCVALIAGPKLFAQIGFRVRVLEVIDDDTFRYQVTFITPTEDGDTLRFERIRGDQEGAAVTYTLAGGLTRVEILDCPDAWVTYKGQSTAVWF